MAPFIPEGLVNPQLNLFFALILGIGFGYILESAGFSSSRKLAGVFYGYDFVVLRVFFTAGVTAMVGLLFFSYLGWIDMSLVYINPLFLWSAIVGGVIMGFGFILGGYCPGTSVVAAVIGKVDAMLFLLGSAIGIFIFGHFYQAFEPIYTGNFLGNVFIYDTLGISRAWFGFGLAAMAIAAFVVTQIIEDRVNETPAQLISQRPSYTVPVALLGVLMLIVLFLPAQKASGFKETAPGQILSELENGEHLMGTEELVYKLMHNDRSMILIDIRPAADYAHFALPAAVNLSTADILQRRYRPLFQQKDKTLVFYGFGEAEAQLAWIAARRAGLTQTRVLEGGLNQMFDLLFNGSGQAKDPLNMKEEFEQRFLMQARKYFLEGGAKHEKAAPPVPVIKTIDIQSPGGRGGC